MTIAASTYMITYSHQLYAVFEPMLGVFERRGAPREPSAEESEQGPLFDVLVFGLGRYGTALALRLRDRGLRVLGIDVNPQAVRRWRRSGLDAEHGDAADPEFAGGCRSTARSGWSSPSRSTRGA